MEQKIKDIINRRGALHVVNGHRFYTEESVINCLKEAFGLLPSPEKPFPCFQDNNECSEQCGLCKYVENTLKEEHQKTKY